MVTRKRFDARSALPGSPFLTHVTLREDRVQPGVYPFTVPWLLPSLDLQLSAPVTFLVGENGTGKSTLLEAIAWSVGFGAQGGNRDQSFGVSARPARPDGSKDCAIRDRDPFTDVAYIPRLDDFQPRWRANPPGHVPGDGSLPGHKGFPECA
jgi:hypothetical protein